METSPKPALSQSTPKTETPSPNPILPPQPKDKKVWKIIGIVVTTIIIIFILLAWYGYRLEKQKSTSNQEVILTSQSMNKTTMQFPTAQYKDFTIAANSNSLDTAKAYPNLQEYGTPHLEIIKNNDGYSEVNLPLHGIQINIPFGWGSKGGFDTMERIDFFPAPSTDDLKQTNTIIPSIDLGIKVLDSSGLDVTGFSGVMTKVKEMSGGDQRVTIDTDEQNHVFIVKTDTINNPSLTQPSSNYSIYIQDPNPNSTVWIDIALRAPKDQFQKYLGLLGLVYKDIKINWAGLDAYMKGTGQQSQ